MSAIEQAVGRMIKQALDSADVPVKELARESHYSDDAIYAAIRGKRRIPRDARRTLSMVHPEGGLAVAYEETGYGIFCPMAGDQHPQNVLQKAFKEDRDVDQVLKEMGFRLIDKQSPEDLTEEDHVVLQMAAKEVIEEVRALITLLVTWEDRFKIQVVKMLLEAVSEKEKTALMAAR